MSEIAFEIVSQTNKQFYQDCTKYFAALRISGKSDDSFEDEFFFTLPAISGK